VTWSSPTGPDRPGQHNEQCERRDVARRAVETDRANDFNFCVDEPEGEAHRDDSENESGHVDPSGPRAPRPGGVKSRHHDVVCESQKGDRDPRKRDWAEVVTFAQSMAPWMSRPGVVCRSGDREIDGEPEPQKAQQERRDLSPARNAKVRFGVSAGLRRAPWSLNAHRLVSRLTAGDVQTLLGWSFVRVQMAAV